MQPSSLTTIVKDDFLSSWNSAAMRRQVSLFFRPQVFLSFLFFQCIAQSSNAFDDTETPFVGRQGVQIPEDVEAALAQNAASLTPLAMKYTVNYTSDLSMDEAIKVGKLWWGRYFFKPTIVDLHLDGIRYSCRREVTRENPDRKAVQMNYWDRFDGTDFYVLNEPFPGATPSVSIYPYEKRKGPSPEMEYLQRAGFMRHDTTDIVRPPDESLILQRVNEGIPVLKAELTTVDDRDLFLIELANEKTHHFIYLDPERHYALAIYDGRNGEGAQIRRTVNSDFLQFKDPPIWLPQRCQTIWHTWPSMDGKLLTAPFVTEVIEVSSIDKTPLRLSQFQRDIEQPGLAVLDARLPGAEERPSGKILYQVPANMNHLDGVIAAAIEGREYEPPLVSNMWVKIVILSNVVMAAGGMFWLWRRHKKAE